MIRTRFRLTEQEYRAARAEARRLGISLTDLVRRLTRLSMVEGNEFRWGHLVVWD
jgi:hypothetical protein